MSSNNLKKIVGYQAVDDYVSSGMVVGLGTGSTAYYVIERVGQKLKSGELKNILCIPTSEATRLQAESLNIPLISLDEKSELDVCIDGADEVAMNLDLIKGRGAALLREKMIAQCAKKFIIVVDESKLQTNGLGMSGALPVEVTKFCYHHIIRQLKKLESLEYCDAIIRPSILDPNRPLETDNENYIVDLFVTRPIKDPQKAATDIAKIVGVVEHGFFLGMATVCLVGKSDGTVQVIYSQSSTQLKK